MNIAVYTYIRTTLIVSGVVVLLAFGATTFAQESARVQLSERLQERVINLSSNVENRSAAAVRRLEQIEGRIDSRIIKLNTEGVDTALALERFNEGKATLNTARAGITNLSSVADAISGDNPKAAFATVRTEFLAIRANLIATKQAFIDAVNLLKESSMASTDTEPTTE